MRILVLSDIHSNLQKLQAAKQIIHNRKIGLVLLLGDLTQMGGAKEAKQVIDALKPARLLAFAGNF
ncbi:MAG: metallophosphoesterase family protein, partial [Candidatus Diapherotrites archaeon]|nr:metallophosphoesterase family protein [Candidatus Diapherotrites archaeon]